MADEENAEPEILTIHSNVEQVGCNGVGARYSAGVMMVTSRAMWMRVRVGN